ncbi:MAG: hypothetical protein VX930_02075 [Pseudomonadota bacterium]|nr:hypothetical protein [Pseudomonadota bacterium]
MPPDRWARMGLTVEGYQEMRAMKLARDANAPDFGAMAPDFAVERGGTGPFPRRRYVGDWVCGLSMQKAAFSRP